jgi:hypothetical protein
MEAQKLKMEPWMICKTIVADSHHFDKKHGTVSESKTGLK